jgi:hypothetical protein
MKKYFATGQDASNFTNLFFGESEQGDRYRLRSAAKTQNMKTFFQTYCMINPKESRLYDLW